MKIQQENIEKIKIFNDMIESLKKNYDYISMKNEEHKNDVFNMKTLKSSTNKENFKCNQCSDSFQNRYSLENHELEIHENRKEFKCENCGLSFMSKWIYNKHIVMHQQTRIRRCHYFNNEMDCPFMKNGCKFLHEQSEICKFGQYCRGTMCQYRH